MQDITESDIAKLDEFKRRVDQYFQSLIEKEYAAWVAAQSKEFTNNG